MGRAYITPDKFSAVKKLQELGLDIKQAAAISAISKETSKRIFSQPTFSDYKSFIKTLSGRRLAVTVIPGGASPMPSSGDTPEPNVTETNGQAWPELDQLNEHLQTIIDRLDSLIELWEKPTEKKGLFR